MKIDRWIAAFALVGLGAWTIWLFLEALNYYALMRTLNQIAL